MKKKEAKPIYILFKKLLELKLKVYKNLPKTESDKGIDQYQIFELFSNSAL